MEEHTDHFNSDKNSHCYYKMLKYIKSVFRIEPTCNEIHNNKEFVDIMFSFAIDKCNSFDI